MSASPDLFVGRLALNGYLWSTNLSWFIIIKQNVTTNDWQHSISTGKVNLGPYFILCLGCISSVYVIYVAWKLRS